METKITTEKQKATVVNRSNISEIFIHITANYRNETVLNEGLETEKVVGAETISGLKYLQFGIENYKDAYKLTLKELIEAAIEDAKSKH